MTERPWDGGTLSPLKRAYLALEQLHAKVEALEHARTEPIAIIGIGCRFPGDANTPESFWRLLRNGVDAISDVPADRWAVDTFAAGTTVPSSGGFLKDVDRFDPTFFGISPREAVSLDPQHRLLLEVAWEALERAGQVQNRLADDHTGVFVGITSHDYAQLHGASSDTSVFDAYHITGNALNAAAGRLSYVFGFRGPCIAVDTACSSSLVAVHLACRSLAGGECSVAVAGGVNLILSPIASLALARARVLSADGRCRAFDAAADGMGRGEGCGVVVLKRLSDAVRDGNHIVATIAGSAINQDGPSSGLTVPNGPAQEALIRRALASAGLSANQIDCIEAHGTGTPLGDPVEFGALTAVFGPGRPPDRPLQVGSVKSNIGHSEAAAGIAGLIKAALSVYHGEIPPHLHFTRPSPHIRWSGVPIEIATASTTWPARSGKRAVGINSFGFTGTNAHVIVQEAPAAQPERTAAHDGRPQLLVLSGRSRGALNGLAARYEEQVSVSTPARLPDICYTASVGRGHFEHRLAIQAASAAQMKEALRSFGDGLTTGFKTGHVEATPRIAWAFSDDDGQPLAVTAAIAERERAFRQTLERCDRILRPSLGRSLFDLLDPQGAASGELVHRHAALFATQYAFAQLWLSWRIVPDALIGHGVGEYAAAATAEILTLDDALRLIVCRARLFSRAIDRRTTDADAEDLMESFRVSASDLQYHTPKIRVAALSAGPARPPATAAEHWANEFSRRLSTAPARREWPVADHDVVMEVGPAASDHPVAAAWLPGISADRSAWEQILDTLGELYVRGAEVDWRAFWRDGPGRHTVLPTYPFDRQRYWIPSPSKLRGTARARAAGSDGGHPLLGHRLQLAGTSELRFESGIRADSPGFLRDHRVFGEAMFPAAAYLELAFAAARTEEPSRPIELRDVGFQRPLILSDDRDTTIQTVLSASGTDQRRFQIFSRTGSAGGADDDRWVLHCSGLLTVSAETAAPGPVLESLQRALVESVPPEDIYEQCRLRGIDLGPQFRALTHIVRRDGEALGVVQPPPDLLADAQRFAMHPVLLDGCLQVLSAAGRESGRANVYLPLTLGRVRLIERPPARLWSYARIRPATSPDPASLTVDFWWFADDGRLVGTLHDLQLQRASAALLRRPDRVAPDWLYEIQWHSQHRPHGLQRADRVTLIRTVCAEARRATPAPLSEPECHAYQRVVRGLDDLSTWYAVQALRILGCEFAPGVVFTTRSLAAQIGVADRHHKQLNRFVELVAEDGWVERSGDGWQVTAAPPLIEPDQRARRLELDYPAARHEVQMLRRCGSRLADVLRGQCDPLDLLFPDGETVTAASLYRDSPGALAANAVIEGVFTSYLEGLPPGHRIRVMEVGAGTGGTTASLLPHFIGKEIDYVFTDVSAAFVRRARERFANHPFVEYRTFDIETSPAEQGFASGTFDVVIAANVLHATRDLRQSLGHIHDLLAPGGMLVLLEGVAPLRFIDLMFGLTEGWWRFTDVTLRGTHPLVSALQWRELLQRTGFDESTVVTPEGQPGFFANQAVLLSHRKEDDDASRPAELWVIFADRAGVGRRLAAQLSADGALCRLVMASGGYEAPGGNAFAVDPGNPEHYERLLGDVARTAGRPVRGIIHLWALDAPEAGDASAIQGAAQLQCGSVLHVVQALARAAPEKPPRLVLVTRGAQPAGDDRAVPGLFQSPLWGMARTLALEHPELECVRLDLDPSDLDHVRLARSVANELAIGGPEDQVAHRGENRLVARLARHPFSTSDADPLPLEFGADATYLITGGLSGLGLLVAQWMAGRGACHLALMARSEPSARTRTELEALRDRGVTATFYQGDVSEIDDLDRVLKQIARSSPPLRGVIHSAGVLADGSLLHQTWDGFERVLKPKVDGGWNLHTATLGMPLDFFVLFSSAASMLGSPAQANHCAANAFLDALAAYRQAGGLPALSINWGAWSEIGSAARSELSDRLARHGMSAMTPTQGLSVLEYLMTDASSQVGAIQMQWSSVLRQFPAGTEPPFFSLIAAAERERVSLNGAGGAGETRHFPRNADLAERSRWLQGYLSERVAAALQLPSAQLSPTKPLNHLGLDSLMAIELRNHIKTDLAFEVPAVKFLEGTTIADLAGDLARTENGSVANHGGNDSGVSDWSASEVGIPDLTITPDRAGQLLSRVGELSNEEVEALLAAVAERPE